MPATVTIDPALGFICLRAEGILTDEEFLAALRAGYEDLRFHPDMRGLGDYTAVTDFRLSSSSLITAAQISRFSKKGRQATLVENQLGFGLARMNTAYVDEAVTGTPEIFTDRISALLYLNEGFPPELHIR